MMKTAKQMSIVAFGVIVAASMAYSSNTLPFPESFADYSAWTANDGPAEAIFNIEPSGGVVGSYLTMAEDDEAAALSIAFATGYSNVWWRGYAKVSAYILNDLPDATELGDAAAAFYVGTTNVSSVTELHLYAPSNDVWVSFGDTDFDGQNPTNTWIGYAVRLDYVASEWDLFVSTSTDSNAGFTKVNTTPLAFSDEYGAGTGQLESFTVKHNSSIDEFLFVSGVAGEASPAMAYFGSRTLDADTWTPSHVSSKDYNGDGNLAGALGADLALGLQEGDQIAVYISNEFNVYALLANGDWVMTVGSVTPAAATLTKGTAYWIKPTAARTTYSAYLDAESVPENVESTAILEQNTTEVTIASEAWTPVRWTVPSGTTSRLITAINLPALADDTELFVVRKGSTRIQRARKYDGGWVPRPLSAPTPSVLPGDVIWFNNVDAAPQSWIVTW